LNDIKDKGAFITNYSVIEMYRSHGYGLEKANSHGKRLRLQLKGAQS